jgi:hypothetical protein
MNRQPVLPSLYRRYFTSDECAMLDATPSDDLTSEIELLRLLLARVLAAAKRKRSISLELHASMLSAFSAAGIVIAALVRLQLKLHLPTDELWREVEAGKEIGRRRRHVYDYFAPPANA